MAKLDLAIGVMSAICAIFWIKSEMASISFDQARQALAEGHIYEARALVHKALSLAPNNAYYLSIAGLVDERAASTSRHATYGQMLLSVPDETGLVASEAYAHYRAANRLSPRDPRIWASLSWVAFERGDVSEARSELDRALQFGGNDPTLWVLKYVYAKAGGDPEEAQQSLASAIEVSPSVAGSYFFRDVRNECPTCAARALLDATTTVSHTYAVTGSPVLGARLARLLMERGELIQAYRLATLSLDALPDLSEAWCTKAFCALQIGKRAEAPLDFRTAYFLDPRSLDAVVGLCTLSNQVQSNSCAAADWLKSVDAINSQSAIENGQRYHVRPTVEDDVLPNSLLSYCCVAEARFRSSQPVQ